MVLRFGRSSVLRGGFRDFFRELLGLLVLFLVFIKVCSIGSFVEELGRIGLEAGTLVFFRWVGRFFGRWSG